jgi:hypothetical protein
MFVGRQNHGANHRLFDLRDATRIGIFAGESISRPDRQSSSRDNAHPAPS